MQRQIIGQQPFPQSYELDYIASWSFVQYRRHGKAKLRMNQSTQDRRVYNIVTIVNESTVHNAVCTIKTDDIHAYVSDNDRRIRVFRWLDKASSKSLAMFWDIQFQDRVDCLEWCKPFVMRANWCRSLENR
jgi:hypothetical protein